jgi:hypothetical protein
MGQIDIMGKDAKSVAHLVWVTELGLLAISQSMQLQYEKSITTSQNSVI